MSDALEQFRFSSQPKVSVIVPVYNAQEYLEQSMAGILNQTLEDIEIICVNDGSSDKSLEILQSLAKKDHRIHVRSQQNSGAGVARNAGLQVASGKYVSFLDADDRFEPDLLQEAYLLCEEHQADICCYAADTFNADSGIISSYRVAFDRRFLCQSNPFDPSSEEAHEKVLQMFNGVPWSKLFRRDFIQSKNLTFQPLRTTNDAYFVYSALCLARSIVTLDRILVHRRKNVMSGLTQTRSSSPLCFYQALLGIKEKLQAEGVYDQFERTFVNRALQNITWNMETVSKEAAMQIFTEMKSSGFANLGIPGHTKEYFYDKNAYQKYSAMSSADHYETYLHLRQEEESSQEIKKDPVPSSVFQRLPRFFHKITGRK